MSKRILTIFIITFVLIVGIFIGHHFGVSQTQATQNNENKKPLYWIDAMEPNIHYPKSGLSRMGMQLQPVYAENETSNTVQPTIRISPAIINDIGVRTAPVIQSTLARQITTIGYVQANENNISHVHTFTDGWIMNLQVKTAGEFVKKDQLIFQFYSPMLVNAQQEYLLALANNNSNLIDASVKKLLALGVSQQQFQTLKQTHQVNRLIDVYAHQNGIISTLNVREGMHVTTDTEVMSLTDLSSIWMMAEVMENQADWVQVGQRVKAELPSMPGKIWQGVVDYVYPELDATTRTLKVRLRFDNPEDELKPNMYAEVTLYVDPKINALSIPREALIPSQEDDHVIVALDDGRFQPRLVVAGIESGDRIAILSGLKLGEQVVTSAQFLIDSEANLRSSFQRMANPTNNSNMPTQNKKD